MEKISFQTIYSFFNTTMRFLMSGGKTVETEEAIRRSNICMECPFNNGKIRGKCPNCFARKAVSFVFGTRKPTDKPKIPFDDNPHTPFLYGCEQCGCDLRVKVWLPLEILRDDKEKYPEWCWMRDGHEDRAAPGIGDGNMDRSTLEVPQAKSHQ